MSDSEEHSYESQRWKRIHENESFLSGLGLGKDKATLKTSLKASGIRDDGGNKSASSKGKKRKRPDASKKSINNQHIRRSGRLKGVSAESIFIKEERNGKVIVGTSTTNGKAVENTISKGLETGKDRGRFEEQVLDLGLEANDFNLSGEAFFNALAAKGASEDDKANKKFIAGEEILKLSKSFSKFKCTNVAKLCPSRIYSVQFCGVAPLVVAGDKEGNIGMYNWDISTEDTVGDGTMQYRPHTSTVNVLQFIESSMYSISYDGTVRVMDLNKPGKFELVYSTDNSESPNSWLQYGTLVEDKKHLCLCNSDGRIFYRSMKSKPTKSSQWSFQAHDKKVQTVSLYEPQNILVSASLDRSIRVWDLRKLPSSSAKESDSSKAIAFFEDTNSVSACFINPTGTHLSAVGMSNKIHLFNNPGKKSGKITPDSSIRHNNQTGRYLSVLHPLWDPKRSDVFVCGSLLQPRRIELYTSQRDKIELIMNLFDDELNSVQSRHAFHPSLEMLAAANSSGRLHLFT